MRLSLLLRVSRGGSLERRRPPARGEPEGVVADGLQQRWETFWHLDLVEVTSMYFISSGPGYRVALPADVFPRVGEAVASWGSDTLGVETCFCLKELNQETCPRTA